MNQEALVLDVRPYHERKEEPFDAIMQTVDKLEPGQPLLLINSFAPTPLVRVMDRRGYDADLDEVAPGEWHVTFTPKCSETP